MASSGVIRGQGRSRDRSKRALKGTARSRDRLIMAALTDPKQQSYPNGKGGVDIHAEDGRGARFDSEDQFKGFLEPRRK